MNLGFCMSTSHWDLAFLSLSEKIIWQPSGQCCLFASERLTCSQEAIIAEKEVIMNIAVSTTRMCLSVQLLHVWVLWRKRKLDMKHDQILPQSSIKYLEYSRILLSWWFWSLEREISNRGLEQSRDYPSTAAIRNRHKFLEEQHGPFPGLFCPDYAYL